MAHGDQQSEQQKLPLETDRTPRPRVAWQPITPRGISDFAQESYGRLMLVVFVVAALIAGLGCWFVDRAVLPAVEKAILALPDTGAIQNQELVFPRKVGPVLVEERVLGIIVNLDGLEHTSLASDFQITLRKRDVQLCSLLGCMGLNYPNGWIIEVNRSRWEPGLPAWKPMIFGILFMCLVASLLICWHGLATLYCLVPWFISYYSDRRLSLGGSWRVSLASLLPGALLMAGGILLYGLGWIDLVRIGVIGILHLVLPWVLLVSCVRTISQVDDGEMEKQNPFGPPPPPVLPEIESNPAPRPNKNPFADTVASAEAKREP